MFDWNRLTRLRKYKRFYSLLRTIYSALVIQLMLYSITDIVGFAVSLVKMNRGFGAGNRSKQSPCIFITSRDPYAEIDVNVFLKKNNKRQTTIWAT